MGRNAHEAAGEVALSPGQGRLVSPALCGDSCPQLLRLCRVQERAAIGHGPCRGVWEQVQAHARRAGCPASSK